MPSRSDLTTTSKSRLETNSPSETLPQTRVLPRASEFIVEHWPKLSGISALVLAPCFWHRHIEAGDLASHTYNAWLAQLIEQGQIPGLWIAHPWTNVLFDYLLTGFGKLFGLQVGEKVSIALAILIFFWGTFALVSAAGRRAPWFLTPIIAMVAYGWTFEMGFLNYYLSLGLSFFALAIFWRGTGWERAVAIAFMPFIYLAHPLGIIWLVSAAAYIWIAKLVPLRFQFLLVLGAAVGLWLLRLYLWRHFITDTVDEPLYIFNGGDQLVLFGDRYKIIEALLGAFVVVGIAIDTIVRRRVRGFWHAYLLPLQLYALAEVGVFLLPDGVRAASQPVALALLTERVSSVSAVLVCCLLGAMLPRKWHLIALTGIAAAFFLFLYQDTAIANRMETQVERLTGTLPPGQRVLATIRKPDESRVLMQHIVDRACIGHCFSYGNYEPPSAAFRIRVNQENHYVMTDSNDTASMEEGDYTVRPEDLPAYQIYQCNEDWTVLCIRPLEAGEENDRLGVHPDD
ncbi:MAG: hypothetical protein WB987_05080 [Candidatus Acidiferrales bacterium]